MIIFTLRSNVWYAVMKIINIWDRVIFCHINKSLSECLGDDVQDMLKNLFKQILV